MFLSLVNTACLVDLQSKHSTFSLLVCRTSPFSQVWKQTMPLTYVRQCDFHQGQTAQGTLTTRKNASISASHHANQLPQHNSDIVLRAIGAQFPSPPLHPDQVTVANLVSNKRKIPCPYHQKTFEGFYSGQPFNLDLAKHEKCRCLLAVQEFIDIDAMCWVVDAGGGGSMRSVEWSITDFRIRAPLLQENWEMNGRNTEVNEEIYRDLQKKYIAWLEWNCSRHVFVLSTRALSCSVNASFPLGIKHCVWEASSIFSLYDVLF